MLLSYSYMRCARIKSGGDSYYHCVSRVIDRKFALKRQEKDRLVRAVGSGFNVLWGRGGHLRYDE